MSDCDLCFHDYDYGDSADCYRVLMRKARKPHKCEECGGTIPARAEYEYASGVHDGSAFSVKTCAGCASVRAAYVCGFFYHGTLWDSMKQNVFDNAKFAMAGPCWEKLTAAGKAHLLDKWRRWKGIA